MTNLPTDKEPDQCVCCSHTDVVSRFDEKEFIWNDRPFLKESTWCLFYMPLNFGGMVHRARSKLKAAKALPHDENDAFVLSDMKSKWIMHSFFNATTADIPDADMVKLSGTYHTKVFEGSYQNMPEWCQEMNDYVYQKTGKQVLGDDMYCYYATCPKCYRKLGKNYVVFFAKVV